VTNLGFELDKLMMEVRLPINKKLHVLHLYKPSSKQTVSVTTLDETLGFAHTASGLGPDRTLPSGTPVWTRPYLAELWLGKAWKSLTEQGLCLVRPSLAR